MASSNSYTPCYPRTPEAPAAWLSTLRALFNLTATATQIP
jgi:hypothetical protein